jgi:iron(III) transport system ATP-binding protein
LLLRPEGLLIRPADEEGAAPAVVEASRLLGATTLVHLAVPDGAGGMRHLHARLPPGGAALSRGQQIGVAIDAARAFVFRAVPT